MSKPTIHELATEVVAMRQHLDSLRVVMDRLLEHHLSRELEVAQLLAEIAQVRSGSLRRDIDQRADADVLMLSIKAAQFGPRGQNPILDALYRIHDTLIMNLETARTNNDKQTIQKIELQLQAAQRIRERLLD